MEEPPKAGARPWSQQELASGCSTAQLWSTERCGVGRILRTMLEVAGIGCELPQVLGGGKYNLMGEGVAEKGMVGAITSQYLQRQKDECIIPEKVTWAENLL